MKIGILGGTFNPVHNAHIKMANEALLKFNLDRIMFLPNCIPPHKELEGSATNKHRIEMLKIALGNNDKFFISDYELKKGGKSYSYDTISHFIKDGNEYVFIIGADSFYQVLSWKNAEKLIKLCRFLVVGRKYNDKNLKTEIDLFNKKYKTDFVYLEMELMDISSTDIRDRIKSGSSVDGMIDKKVEEYIIKNSLYTKKED